MVNNDIKDLINESPVELRDELNHPPYRSSHQVAIN